MKLSIPSILRLPAPIVVFSFCIAPSISLKLTFFASASYFRISTLTFFCCTPRISTALISAMASTLSLMISAFSLRKSTGYSPERFMLIMGNSLTSISCMVGSTGSCAKDFVDRASEASSTALLASFGVIAKSNSILQYQSLELRLLLFFQYPLVY